jgi:tryptophan synthase beta chain
MPCRVYMGQEDVRRQALNVFKMQAMGAEVYSVTTGSQTLRDCDQRGDARMDGDRHHHALHHRLGGRAAPLPLIVRDFQSVIGRETIAQCRELFGRLPDVVTACVGGGSNAAGMFYPFVDQPSVELVGIEAGGRGPLTGDHASTLSHGQPGILHGSYSYVLQDADGQTAPVHSVSAGLDYPGVGPEHSFWRDTGRVRYTNVSDADALEGFRLCSRLEGILPALETAHAVVETMRIAARRRRDEIVVLCFSGRGDKDCFEVSRLLNAEATEQPH